jgi:tetratricopeptide (TPR) repeat protein
LWRGLAHLFLGDAQASLTDFGQAVQLSRFSPWSMTLHAVALLHAQRSIEALSVLDGVLADDPEMVIARLCRASVRTSLGNFEGAIADLTEILESEPRNADVMALRGNLYVEVSNFAAAERDYELAMKIAGPNDSVRARWMFTRIQHGLLSPQTPSTTPSPAPPPDSPPGAATGTGQTGRAPDSALTGPEATFARALLEGEPTVRQNLSTRWTFGAPRPR